jgi:hypothetical protein
MKRAKTTVTLPRNQSDENLTRPAGTVAALKSVDSQITRSLYLAGGLGLAGLGVVAWGISRIGLGTSLLDELGAFSAGTTGPIWSLAGLVLIYVAFLAQRRQFILQEEALSLNRIELQDTRAELRGQKEQLQLQKIEMEKQNALAQRTAFESSFFELLRFHRQAVAELRATPGSATYSGQDAFAQAAQELSARLSVSLASARSPEQQLESVSRHVSDVCLSTRSDFGHYFRTVYHLVKLIAESDQRANHRYAALLRAQFSNAELLLLLANGLTEIGRDKFKPLIEEYALLKPVRTDQNIAQPFDRLRIFYTDDAFGLAPSRVIDEEHGDHTFSPSKSPQDP